MNIKKTENQGLNKEINGPYRGVYDNKVKGLFSKAKSSMRSACKTGVKIAKETIIFTAISAVVGIALLAIQSKENPEIVNAFLPTWMVEKKWLTVGSNSTPVEVMNIAPLGQLDKILYSSIFAIKVVSFSFIIRFILSFFQRERIN